ncbi:MAG TPA: tetratricopeptide repeat protein [Verrucomicrobiae bacterium]|nr:tetratricopeptide repeat protein [Verrucomicrobiae bacterium]
MAALKLPPAARLPAVVGALLALLTLALYAPALGFEFNNYDDAQYITSNVRLQDGWSGANVEWAFTSHYAGNWHPLTWLSHMLDCQIYGLRAGGHHASSVLLHTLNTLLLFGLWRRMTGQLWRSALLAALFAWHPLHVESVAFVAERKDVLSAFFGLATLWAYWFYAQAPGGRRYALVTLGFICALMSKPMLVTLPILMLLLDFWPLRRAGPWRQLILEKTPWLALSAASSAVTIWAQKQGGAVASVAALPFPVRAANALHSCVNYIEKIFWPVRLSAYYPYPRQLAWGSALLGAVIVIGFSIAVCLGARRRPYAFVGWFWFLVGLLPVIGLIQVGAQSMADRYTYLPALGIFIIVIWEIAERGRAHPAALSWAAAVALLGCLATASHQLSYWRDSTTLFAHAIAVTPENAFAQCSLGRALLAQNRAPEAVECFRAALRAEPKFDEAAVNLGLALLHEGKTNEAAAALSDAIAMAPRNPYAEFGLGRIFDAQDNLDAAIAHYGAAVRLKPDLAEAQTSLGAALAAQHRFADAAAHFTAALQANPQSGEAHFQFGNAQLAEGRLEEAAQSYGAAAALEPETPAIEMNLAIVLERQGKTHEASAALERAAVLAEKSGDSALAARLRRHQRALSK